MAGEVVLIRELTGSHRSVELRDRALPFRGVPFQRSMAIKATEYAGNPQATIQVLGPRWKGLDLGGVWHARYVGDAVTLEGFDDIWTPGTTTSPELLVQVFDRILLGGNLLEVSFGPETWRGVMTEFSPTYDLVEDIAWSISIRPSSMGRMEAPRATAAESPFDALQAALEQLNAAEAAAAAQAAILAGIASAVLAAQNAAAIAMLALTGKLADISGIPMVTSDEFRGVASSVDAVTAAAATIIDLATYQSPEALVATDDVATTMAAQLWAADYGAAARGMAAAAIRARESVRARVVDDIIARVVLGQNRTLRHLAAEYYGSADEWPVIASANGLATSSPPFGTMILIPRKASAGA